MRIRDYHWGAFPSLTEIVQNFGALQGEAVRIYREEESRYKADRKKVSRAKRIIDAKQKRERADSSTG